MCIPLGGLQRFRQPPNFPMSPKADKLKKFCQTIGLIQVIFCLIRLLMSDSNALMGLLCTLFLFCGTTQGNPSCFLYYIFYMLLSFVQTLSLIGLAVQNQILGTGLAVLF